MTSKSNSPLGEQESSGSTDPIELEHLQQGDLPRSDDLEAWACYDAPESLDGDADVRMRAVGGKQLWTVQLEVVGELGRMTIEMPAPEAREFLDELAALLDEIEELPPVGEQ